MARMAQKQGHTCEARHCSECNSCLKEHGGAGCADPCSSCNECTDNATGCKAKCEWRATSCDQKLDPAQLSGMSSSALRLMRNEIFARYGYEFRSQLLTTYFRSTNWYDPYCESVDGLLSKNEKARIEAIKKAESAATEAELAVLPPDVRAFWAEFRAAAATGDLEKLAPLIAWPLERGKVEKLSKEQYPSMAVLPPAALDALKFDLPHVAGDGYEWTTLPLYPGERIGRSYRFRKVGEAWRLTGYD